VAPPVAGPCRIPARPLKLPAIGLGQLGMESLTLRLATDLTARLRVIRRGLHSTVEADLVISYCLLAHTTEHDIGLHEVSCRIKEQLAVLNHQNLIISPDTIRCL
jgi:hypothetical protein